MLNFKISKILDSEKKRSKSDTYDNIMWRVDKNSVAHDKFGHTLYVTHTVSQAAFTADVPSISPLLLYAANSCLPLSRPLTRCDWRPPSSAKRDKNRHTTQRVSSQEN
jgi:hypothetical protein